MKAKKIARRAIAAANEAYQRLYVAPALIPGMTRDALHAALPMPDLLAHEVMHAVHELPVEKKIKVWRRVARKHPDVLYTRIFRRWVSDYLPDLLDVEVTFKRPSTWDEIVEHLSGLAR